MVDFVKAQFGIDAAQLTYQDIVNFFAVAKIESVNLEFKSNNDRKIPEKIYNTICAMLNSSGGLIVWGAPKETKLPTGSKECCGALTPFTEPMKREDVMRSIADKIVPIPSGIDVFEIADNARFNFIYLFQVQKSDYSPHQTDNRYYMRLDTETRIAPHYFVEALFRKVKYPDLNGRVDFLNITFMDTGFKYILIVLKVVIKNNSPLQNEEYPEYIISSNIGNLLESHESWPPRDSFPNIRSIHKPLEILYYGKKVEALVKLGLHSYELDQLKKQEGAKLNLFLRFGRRYSPLKFSFYEIDLTFFDKLEYNQGQSYPIPAEHIQSLENKLVADASFDLEVISEWNSLSS